MAWNGERTWFFLVSGGLVGLLGLVLRRTQTPPMSNSRPMGRVVSVMVVHWVEGAYRW